MKQTYRIGPYVVGLQTNSKKFGAWLEKTFSTYRSSEEIGPLYSIHVGETNKRKPGRPFHVLRRNSLVLARELDLRDIAQMLRAEFESLLFADWDESIYSETVIVSHNGAAALLPVVGAARLTDIWRKVDRARVSMPLPGRIAIDPDSGRLLPIPPRLTIPDAALDELTRIAPQNGAKRRTAATPEPPRIAAVCLPMPRPLREEEYDLLKPISRAAAIKVLADVQAVNVGPMGPRVLEGFARLTEGAACYELVHRNADELLEGLVGALDSNAAPST